MLWRLHASSTPCVKESPSGNTDARKFWLMSGREFGDLHDKGAAGRRHHA
jgi:hypothetical protein